MGVKIVFTKDFADRKKESNWDNCPTMLANRLVNIDKVAKYVEDKKPAKK